MFTLPHKSAHVVSLVILLSGTELLCYFAKSFSETHFCSGAISQIEPRHYLLEAILPISETSPHVSFNTQSSDKTT